MSGKDKNYQVVFQGKSLTRYSPGGWVLFQRIGDPADRDGERTYWLGRTMAGLFAFGPNYPVGYDDAILYIIHAEVELRTQSLPPEDTSQIPLF